jgi:hypothetical protein
MDSTEPIGRAGGGAYSSKSAHLEWFEVAGNRIEDITMSVLTADAGESDFYSMGLIGGGLLRNFRLVFDYANRRVAIRDL